MEVIDMAQSARIIDAGPGNGTFCFASIILRMQVLAIVRTTAHKDKSGTNREGVC
jgi:hypothetical protein